MAAAIAGGRDRLRERPIIEFGGCPVSPLRLPRELTEVAVTAARNGIPFGACSMVMAGASAPVTLAGALVTHNVEVLATLVLVQSVERGSPFRASSSSTGMDLRVGTCPVGSPGVLPAQRRRRAAGAPVQPAQPRRRVVGGLQDL